MSSYRPQDGQLVRFACWQCDGFVGTCSYLSIHLFPYSEPSSSSSSKRLPLVLQAISEAHFVSIDLEMSGIATNKTNDSFSPSLQQLYEDAKAAAQTYSILQIGLTCISWSDTKKAYITKTFAAPLALGIVGGNPHSDQLSSKLERQVGFSSKTIAFLQSNNFRFSHVFDKGIPYLSAVEAAHDDVVAFLEAREDHDHIDTRNGPQETARFYRTMRSQIQAWVNEQVFQEVVKPLVLINPYHGRFHRYQKRLVCQLVNTEFPGYKVQSRDGSSYMEVTRGAPGPGHNSKEGRRQAVAKQYGFTHVWAALTGQSFAAKIDRGLVGGSTDPHKTQTKLFEYERHIKKNRPVIVGHNMLWDLCFLFRTFAGHLPDRVEDFQKVVRDKMPRVVDTKYLFTRGHHEMMPDQSLGEYFAQVQGDKSPLVVPDELCSYDKPASHQAGYDSYMTAVVFLKKAYQLSQAREPLTYIPAEDHEQSKPGFFTAHTLRNGHPVSVAPSLPRGRATDRSASLLDNDCDENLAIIDAKFQPMTPTPEQAYGKGEGEDHQLAAKLPEWTDEKVLWKKYGNKVRGGWVRVILYTGPKRVVI